LVRPLDISDRRSSNIIDEHPTNLHIQHVQYTSHIMAWLQLSEESKERIARVLDMSRVAIH
jgi:hypothetical protein